MSLSRALIRIVSAAVVIHTLQSNLVTATSSFKCSSNHDCHHGGICIVNRVEDVTHLDDHRHDYGGYCQCPAGYQSTPDCSGSYYCPRICQNQGQCRRTKVIASTSVRSATQWSYYCDCPVTATGASCEYLRSVQCPDRVTYCVPDMEMCQADATFESAHATNVSYLCVSNTTVNRASSPSSARHSQRTGRLVGMTVLLVCALILAGMVTIRRRARRQRHAPPCLGGSYQDGGTASTNVAGTGSHNAKGGQFEPDEERIVEFDGPQRCII
jgi:hypothetical protein